jgi:hypothetical protein
MMAQIQNKQAFSIRTKNQCEIWHALRRTTEEKLAEYRI